MAMSQVEAPDLYDQYRFPGERDGSFEQTMLLGYLGGMLSSSTVRAAVISDRSPLNLQSICNYAAQSRGFELGGVIVPGSELDSDLTRLVLDQALIRADYDGTGEEIQRLPGLDESGRPIDKGDFIVTDHRGDETFRLAHEGYDAKRLRLPGGEGEQYRMAFGRRLVRSLEYMDPTVVFLDNFKVILPPNVVEQFPGLFINVHPSQLPLLKGFRPEKRAYEGENPDANGYTIHVVSEDLDGGATLFQQRVPLRPVDQELRDKLGEQAYETAREEQARLRIMAAQAPFVPWVLDIYNSRLERKVVEDAEAFAAEGRPGFEKSAAYQRAVAEEPDGKPYQRVLFHNPLSEMVLDQPEYVTLETILSAPAEASLNPQIAGIEHYKLVVPVFEKDSPDGNLTQVQLFAQELEQTGLSFEMIIGSIQSVGDHGSMLCEVDLWTLGDCSESLTERGIMHLKQPKQVNVRTPRQPVTTRSW
jgi:folate-dependent phosphoribosylglycinamide formyltransferase PurN